MTSEPSGCSCCVKSSWPEGPFPTGREPYVRPEAAPPASVREVTAWTDYLPVLKAALGRAGSMRLPLLGSSMLPTLPSGCEVEIVPLTGGPVTGSLVVLVNSDGLVAHRVVRRQGEVWVTQGDGRRCDDGRISSWQLLGKVQTAYRDGRRIWPRPCEGVFAVFWVARHHIGRGARIGLSWIRRRPA